MQPFLASAVFRDRLAVIPTTIAGTIRAFSDVGLQIWIIKLPVVSVYSAADAAKIILHQSYPHERAMRTNSA